jgi:hypothetical protein
MAGIPVRLYVITAVSLPPGGQVKVSRCLQTQRLTGPVTPCHFLHHFSLQQCRCEYVKSRDLQGSDRGLTKVPFCHFPGVTEDKNAVRTVSVLAQTRAGRQISTNQPSQYQFIFPCLSHAPWLNHHNNQAKSMNYSTDCYVNFSIATYHLLVPNVKKIRGLNLPDLPWACSGL